MNFALLVANLPGVYHVQSAEQLPTVANKPVPSALKQTISRLLSALHSN